MIIRRRVFKEYFMKKSRIFAFILSIAIFMLSVFAAGCSSAISLDKPYGLSIDEYNNLSWVFVDDARSYLVSVTDTDGVTKEESARRANYPLAYLDYGDYEIKVKAVGDNKNYADSVWSETYYFHRDYETGCLYTLINNDSEYEIRSVGSATGEISLDGVYRGKPVTSVGDDAFKGSRGVQKIKLGNNINRIGESAFYSCLNLTEIEIPDSVAFIGKSAFQSCSSLTSVTLPESMTSISESTFAYCRSLTSIDLTGIQSIGKSAFSNCDKISELVIPDSVTFIDDSAFANETNLKSVTLNSTLEKLSNKTFAGCEALTEINFAEGGKLKEFGQYVFTECKSLTEIALPEGLETVGYASFLDCENLASVDIPDSVTRVGGYAFLRTKIYGESITRGDAFVYVDNWLVQIARGNAESDFPNVKLTGIVSDTSETEERIPDPLSGVEGGYQARFKPGVVGIADSAFNNCEELIFIEIPASVKYIGNYAFTSCDKLYRINTLGGLRRIGMQAFKNCKMLLQLNFSEGLETIGREAFIGCSKLVNPTNRNIIPQSVTQIEPDAFYDTGLWASPDESGVIYAGNWIVGKTSKEQNIKIANPYYEQSGDDSSVNIADYAFFNINYHYYMLYLQHPEYFEESQDKPSLPWTGITSIEGLSNTRIIGEGAFYGCNLLTTAYVGNNVREIKDYTFYGCEALEKVNIPYMLEKIGKSAFYNCKNLRDVVNAEAESAFPDFDGLNLYGCRVTEIGDYAFFGTALEGLNLGTRIREIGEVAFGECGELKSAELPDTLNEIKYGTFERCEKLTDVKIGANIVDIGGYAFYKCGSLSGLEMPDSVKTIGEYAFCESGLQAVSFGQGLREIGGYAFASTGLNALTLPSGVQTISDYAFRDCSDLKTAALPEGLKHVGLHAFYGCGNMTAYMQADGEPESWAVMWNSSYRPEVWGCEFSEDGSYVVSLTVGENTLEYVSSAGDYVVVINAPYRNGYKFLGWSVSQDSSTAEYSAEELSSVPVNTKLYAVWIAN